MNQFLRKSKKIKDSIGAWIEKKPNTAQFLVNSTLAILTFLTLLTTAYFSNKGIRQSKLQYAQADTQLNLAIKQYNTGLQQHRSDSINNLGLQIEASKKQKSDSIISEIRYKTQQRQNFFQDSINREQLKAIELQAKLAALQYENQLKANKEQFYQARPIFMLAKTSFDTIKNIGDFVINNVGKRSANIINSKICAYNHQYNSFFQNVAPKMNMTLNQTISLDVKLPMSRNIFNDYNTYYYISLEYIDVATGKKKIFDKYFKWSPQTIDSVNWSDADELGLSLMIKRAKALNFKFSDPISNVF